MARRSGDGGRTDRGQPRRLKPRDEMRREICAQDASIRRCRHDFKATLRTDRKLITDRLRTDRKLIADWLRADRRPISSQNHRILYRISYKISRKIL